MIGSHIKRIAALTIFLAALIEFAIERAWFDLWFVTFALVILLGNAVGRARGSHVDSDKLDHKVSASPR